MRLGVEDESEDVIASRVRVVALEVFLKFANHAPRVVCISHVLGLD